jgi:RNA-directed DNA polymerase
MSQGLDGVRKAAKERKQERFTALLHHLNIDLLRDSFYALQRKASPGVDGVTWQEYETGLEDRLVDLHSRVHRRAYRAKPSRRVFIPKADGRYSLHQCQGVVGRLYDDYRNLELSSKGPKIC